MVRYVAGRPVAEEEPDQTALKAAADLFEKEGHAGRTLPGITHVVVTADVGGYDFPRESYVRDPRFRYIAFTDYPRLVGGWETHNVHEFVPDGIPSNLTSRYPKLCPFEIFPDAEVVIWIDANMTLNTRQLYEAVSGVNHIAVPPHPKRRCAYAEMAICKKRFPAGTTYDTQLEKYTDEGFPKNSGLTHNSRIVRRRTDAMVAQGRLWWTEMLRGCHRDQVSLQYTLWKLGIDMEEFPAAVSKSLKKCGGHLAHKILPDGTASAQSKAVENSKHKECWTNPGKWASYGFGQTGWYRLAADFIREGDTVLDYGCGPARMHGELLAARPAQLTGVDISEAALAKAANLSDVHKTGTPDILGDGELFDVVTCIDVLEHVPDDIPFIKELYRRARRTMIVTTPNAARKAGPPEEHIREYDIHELESLILNVCGPNNTYIFIGASGKIVSKGRLHGMYMNTTLTRGAAKCACIGVIVIKHEGAHG